MDGKDHQNTRGLREINMIKHRETNKKRLTCVKGRTLEWAWQWGKLSTVYKERKGRPKRGVPVRGRESKEETRQEEITAGRQKRPAHTPARSNSEKCPKGALSI